ncbi:unnamed protein product [Acanthosepion pharaonis]|uniref:Uncharacterized protein n=1 Tax=Acanthosepion pharaonis TaxID=158019 RepID=A0A812C9W9_ACAPH|nr:unnamed protein product [Sepia pharaonis]
MFILLIMSVLFLFLLCFPFPIFLNSFNLFSVFSFYPPSDIAFLSFSISFFNLASVLFFPLHLLLSVHLSIFSSTVLFVFSTPPSFFRPLFFFFYFQSFCVFFFPFIHSLSFKFRFFSFKLISVAIERFLDLLLINFSSSFHHPYPLYFFSLSHFTEISLFCLSYSSFRFFLSILFVVRYFSFFPSQFPVWASIPLAIKRPVFLPILDSYFDNFFLFFLGIFLFFLFFLLELNSSYFLFNDLYFPIVFLFFFLSKLVFSYFLSTLSIFLFSFFRAS